MNELYEERSDHRLVQPVASKLTADQSVDVSAPKATGKDRGVEIIV